MTTTPRPHRIRARLTAGALALLLLAGCSSATDEATNDEAVGAAQESVGDAAQIGDPVAEDRAPAEGGEAGGVAEADEAGAAGADNAAQATLPEGRMIARDATMSISVQDVAPGAAQVRAAAAAAEGYVVQEEIHPGAEDGDEDGDSGYATLVISVPTSRLDQAMAQLEEIGEVTERGMTSLDVTTDYVDTTARIETLEASVERTRALMADATSIEDVVALESELTRREADLDALRAHAESLANDVSRSSVTVSLSEVEPDGEVADAEPAGFLHGLGQGWDAFTTAGTAAMTALGAVLPFAALAALVGLPVLALRRRRRGPRREVALGG